MTREEQIQCIAEKLMENPEFRKAFAGAMTDAVNEVVKATKALQQELCNELDFVQPHKKVSVNLEPCDDAISRFEGMTNGEVIKKVFSNIDFNSKQNVLVSGNTIVVSVDIGIKWIELRFNMDWWNAPYKGGAE